MVIRREPKSAAVGTQIALRASSSGYAGAALTIAFAAALIYRLTSDARFPLLAVPIVVAIFIFALQDRVVIDRFRISRTGWLPYVFGVATGSVHRLRISKIAQIETVAVQRLRLGGSVVYLYRTTIAGANARFTIRSNQRNYGRFIKQLFASVVDDILDNRSLELRDYYADRNAVRRRAAAFEIPRGDVLEQAFKSYKQPPRAKAVNNTMDASAEKVIGLRQLANELRIAGFLLQSAEAFRRAIVLQPNNAWLLFEFSRCLLSLAAARRDSSIERRGIALMRLAETRAGRDLELLSRLGEGYYYAGEVRRAVSVLKRTGESIGSTFRAVRALAELALREGKLAHVVNQFSMARSLASAPALRRWSEGEAAYFLKLNQNEEYTSLEVSRLNLIARLSAIARPALSFALVGLSLIVAGEIVDDKLLADVGWATAALAIAAWSIPRVLLRILTDRIPPDSLED